MQDGSIKPNIVLNTPSSMVTQVVERFSQERKSSDFSGTWIEIKTGKSLYKD